MSETNLQTDGNPPMVQGLRCMDTGDVLVPPGGALRYWAAAQPDKTALVDSAGTISYARLHQAVGRLVAQLSARGIGKGSRVVSSLRDGREFTALMYAAFELGYNLIPFDLLLSAVDVERRLAITQPDLVVASQPEHLRVALDKGYAAVSVDVDEAGAPSFDELIGGTQDEWSFDPERPIAADVPALTIFTSGSTGDPKGVLLTEAALVHANRSIGNAVGATRDDVFLTALPMSHIYGVNAGVLLPLMLGATSVTLAKFDPAKMLDAVQDHGVTVLNGVPSMYQRLASEQEQHPRNLETLCKGSIAGARCDGLERYHSILGCYPRVCYGLTEAPLIATTNPGDSLDTDFTGVGHFVDEVEGRIVDEQGCEVETGKQGEIVCKSPGTMMGYLNPVDADRACIDAEGWVHTDDIGWMDERGYIHVAGRKSAVINRGGYKVYPPEIEGLYNTNPAILDCCAMGFDHKQLGQQIVLFVEMNSTVHDVDPTVLRGYAKGKVAKYKIPDQVLVLDKLPRLANGKHDKQALKRIFDADTTVFHSDEERLAKG